MAKLRSKMVVPPHGHHYQQGDIKLVADGTFDGTVALIRKHRISNGMPVGNPEQDLHDFTCWRAPHLCDQRSLEPSLAAKFASYSGMVANYVKSGGKLVDQVEAERRAKICSDCSANQNIEIKRRCCGKGAVRGVIEGLAEKSAAIMNSAMIRNKTTSLDKKLFVCIMCGCPNKSAVWIPNGTFNYTNEQRQAFSANNPNCWKPQPDPH